MSFGMLGTDVSLLSNMQPEIGPYLRVQDTCPRLVEASIIFVLKNVIYKTCKS